MKRRLIILAIIISTKIIYATPMVDVTAKGGAFAATLSINHDCVANDTMLLVACTSYNQPVTSLSWRGKVLTSITTANTAAKYYSVWGLLSPGAGKGNLTVTATSAYCITAISQSLSWAFAYTGQGVETSITHTAQSINLPDTLFIPVCGLNIYDGFTAPAGQTTPVYTGLSNTVQSLGLTEYSPTYSGAFNTYIYTTSAAQTIVGQIPVIIGGNTLTPTTTPIPAIATCTAVLSATVVTGMSTQVALLNTGATAVSTAITPMAGQIQAIATLTPVGITQLNNMATAIVTSDYAQDATYVATAVYTATPIPPVSTCTAVLSATVITGMATIQASMTPYLTATPQTIPANPTANATVPALATAIQSITPYTPPTPVSTCTAVMSATVITGMATVVSSLTPYVAPTAITQNTALPTATEIKTYVAGQIGTAVYTFTPVTTATAITQNTPLPTSTPVIPYVQTAIATLTFIMTDTPTLTPTGTPTATPAATWGLGYTTGNNYCNSNSAFVVVGGTIADFTLQKNFSIDTVIVGSDQDGTVLFEVNGKPVRRYTFKAHYNISETFKNPVYVPVGQHIDLKLESGTAGNEFLSISGHY